jgi:predicted dehydrogenase
MKTLNGLGGAGYVPPSDKVNIAFIGVGAQGLRVMLRFLREMDVQGIAVCDVNKTDARERNRKRVQRI